MIMVRTVRAQRWTRGWTIRILGFDYRRRLGIFLYTTASGTALGPTQHPKGTRGYFPGGKAAGAWRWPLHPVPKWRMRGAIPALP